MIQTGECWACSIVLQALAIVQDLTATFPATLAANLWPLLVAIFLASTTWSMAKALAAGTSPVHPAVQGGMRMLVLAALIAMPGNIGQFASYYLIVPALSGASLGATLATQTASALGVPTPAASCTTVTPATAGITDADYATAGTALVAIICQVQAVTMASYDIGAIVASQQLRSGTSNDLRLAIFYNAVGLMMMYTAFTMLLDFALTLFEAVLRLGIFMTFIPFIAFFWVYPSLRGSTYRAFTNLAFVFVYLTLAGLASTITSMLLLLGMQLGMGVVNGPMQTPATIIQEFSKMISTGATINDAGTLGDAMRFMAYTSICTALAMGMQRGIHGVAMTVTQYRASRTGDRSMAVAAMSSINSLGGMALSGIAGTAAGAGRMLGQVVGRGGFRIP